MKVRVFLFSMLILVAGAPDLARAQDVFFDYSTFEEGIDAARAKDRLLLVYFYDAAAGTADDYNHIWADPLVQRFVDKLAVPVVISSDTEAGAAFMDRRRRAPEVREPGIYFFSKTGRSLGALRGNLAGEEGIGQMMLMLGAADYARHENNDDKWRRKRRW